MKQFLELLGKNKSSFMAWMGAVVMIAFLFTTSYLIFQIMHFFSRNKLNVQELTNLITIFFLTLKELTFTIVLFYYKDKDRQIQTISKQQIEE